MNIRILTVSFLTFLLGVLSRTALGGHEDPAHKCRFARSQYEEMEEMGEIENTTALVHEIEGLHVSSNPDPATLTDLRGKYCDLVFFIDHDIDCHSDAKFRTINGTCNNLDNPTWGASSTPFRRRLPAFYKDYVSTPRDFTSTAREVSQAFVGNEPVPSAFAESELLVHMAQFMDHDLNLTPAIREVCDCENDINCFSIPCTDDDPVCGAQGCIRFARSVPLLPLGVPCDSADIDNIDLSRAQMNGVTSFLDASNVYGSHPDTEKELRECEKGHLRTEEGVDPINQEHIRMLPPDMENEECIVGAGVEFCGKGGDVRAAEQPTLTAIHTLFVNQHNRIADELATINPHWNDERLFQEARKIVGALMQRIIYTEWLPLVLGKAIMQDYGLSIWSNYEDHGGYDKELDPSITTDYATAFLRFGHSMVPEVLERVNTEYEDTHEDVELKEAFFDAGIVHDLGNGGINSLLLGTLEKNLLKVDRHFSESINIHLFKNAGFGGLDLVAINIQRGRDHGLPPWWEYRNALVGDADDFYKFDDLKTVMDAEAVDAFKQVYSTVYEIEPFVGMLAENHLPGALVGPTLAHVLAEQFEKLKYGDRFWYENPDGPQAFDADQLFSINCVTMARIICDNVNVSTVQPAAFKLHDDGSPEISRRFFYKTINSDPYADVYSDLGDFENQRVDCEAYPYYPNFYLPIFDLGPWEEEQTP